MIIRRAIPSDYPWIIETACRIRHPVDEHGRPRVLWRDWRFAYGHLVERWLTDRASVIDAGDDTLLAFAVAEANQVCCVYVKPDFRGNGFGLQLLDAVGTRSPYCPTSAWRAWERTWPTGLTRAA